MNINSISRVNFNANMSKYDYHMDKIEEFLYENHGIGADEIIEFRSELGKLPNGHIEIDEFVQHAGKNYVFGSIYPNCNHRKQFIIEKFEPEKLLSEMIDTFKKTFNEKSDHPECPMCNPTEK